jgi:peptidoglycan hydrolase-like protein with peptidoglycan-binding domain
MVYRNGNAYRLEEDFTGDLDSEFIDSLLEEDLLTPGTGAPPSIDRRSPTYVRWLQQSLNQVIQAGLVVDGILGNQTRRAVSTFQQRAKLVVDGIPGPQTEAALVRAGAKPPPGSGQMPSQPQPQPGSPSPVGRASRAELHRFSNWLLQDYINRKVELDCADLAIELWIHFGERYGIPVSFEQRRGSQTFIISRQGVRKQYSSSFDRRFSSMQTFLSYAKGYLRARDLIYNTVPITGGHRLAISGDVFLWVHRNNQTRQLHEMGHTQIFFQIDSTATDPQNDTIRVVQGNYPAVAPVFRSHQARHFYNSQPNRLGGVAHTSEPVLPAPRRFRSFEHLR